MLDRRFRQDPVLEYKPEFLLALSFERRRPVALLRLQARRRASGSFLQDEVLAEVAQAQSEFTVPKLLRPYEDHVRAQGECPAKGHDLLGADFIARYGLCFQRMERKTGVAPATSTRGSCRSTTNVPGSSSPGGGLLKTLTGVFLRNGSRPWGPGRVT
jgi:hypothetical protein